MEKAKKINVFVMFLCLLLSVSPYVMGQGVSSKDKRVVGTVVDSNGETIPGVSITVKDQPKTGTLTDVSGRFSIVVKENSILNFSFMGFMPKQVKASAINGGKIVLENDVKTIDEVVVIGYGVVKKSDLTGSVSVVKTGDIKEIPVSRVDQMLQGRISGVDIMSVDGEPGSGTSIRIRGTRSITASNDPLYVVDGVVEGITDLNEINPSDIQSIEVLKDASSTAIYGSRAANGVVLITTKSGQEGKPKFTFKSDVGFSQLPRMLDIMNAEEFAVLYNDYKSLPTNIYNTGTNGASTKPIEGLPYADPFSLGNGTNWTDVVTRTSLYNNHTLSASGGSKGLKYYASANYNNTEGIIKNTGMERIQARVNLSQEFNKYVKAGITMNYVLQNQDKNAVEIGSLTSANINAALSLTPLMPVYKEDGSYNDWNPIMNGKGGYIDSPIARADLMELKNKIKTLASSVFMEITPIKGLSLKTTLSYNDYKRKESSFLPSTLPTRAVKGQGAEAYQMSFDSYNLLNENTVSYRKNVKKHKFDFLYGFTYQKKENTSMSVTGKGYMNDNVNIYDLGAVPTKENLTVASQATRSVMVSNLARINYNFDNRYYFTFTGRADGSSNFSVGNKWAFFPSAALKWNVKNEAFMKGVDPVSGLALRVSGGITGNQGVSPYSSMSKMISFTNGYIFNDAVPSGIYLSQVGSNELTWEKTTSYNFGIDFSFLNNRITLTADGYISKTKDLLLYLQLPGQTGFAGRMQNIGRTSNKGVELAINTVNIDKKNFKWSTMLTLSRNKQMVEDAGGYDRIPTYTPNNYTYEMYGYKQGYPVNALWGMVYAGTWKSKAEIDENKTSKQYVSKTPGYTDLGWAKYVDQNRDGVLDRKDIVYLGCSDPDVYGGFQNRFSVYGFQLSIYFNYSLGGEIFNPLELSMGSGDYQTNQFRYMTKSWHPVRNPDSDIPRANAKDFVVSTYQRHSASFLRLKDISLSYSFDLTRSTKNILDKLTLTASANNVYLWKSYNGFDPEVSSPNGTRRIDTGAYPGCRTVVFGVQLDF